MTDETESPALLPGQVTAGQSRPRCCDGHHFLGCTDDPPFTICCWRCPINPSESPEALTEAIRRA